MCRWVMHQTESCQEKKKTSLSYDAIRAYFKGMNDKVSENRVHVISLLLHFFWSRVYLGSDYCPAGYYSINGAMPCRPCPRNYYQPSLGASSCIECRSNQITLDTAQSSSLGCVSGGMCWTLLFYHLWHNDEAMVLRIQFIICVLVYYLCFRKHPLSAQPLSKWWSLWCY